MILLGSKNGTGVTTRAAGRAEGMEVAKADSVTKKKASKIGEKRNSVSRVFDSDTEVEERQGPKVSYRKRGSNRGRPRSRGGGRGVMGEADGSYDRALSGAMSGHLSVSLPSSVVGSIAGSSEGSRACSVVGSRAGSAARSTYIFFSGQYSVHGIQLEDIEDVKFLYELETNLDLDLWQHGMPGQRDALIMVSPQNRNEFFDYLDERGLVHYLKIADVAKALEEHDQTLSQWRMTRQNRMVFQDYPRYAEIEAYMERMAEQYPNLVTYSVHGIQLEDIEDVKFLYELETNLDLDLWQHGMPGQRDALIMVSPQNRNEFFDYLDERGLVHYLKIADVAKALEEHDQTLSQWRMTRQNRMVFQDYPRYAEIEAYMERMAEQYPNLVTNFDIHFNTIGVSSNPCSDIYPGTAAFSEPETRVVRDILMEHLDRIQLYNDVHSFGNYVLFGFDNLTLPENAPQLHFVAAAMGATMDTLKLEQADYYLVGNSAMVLYAVSGSGQDYAQDIGVPLSYTMELPSYGYDFRVPPTYMDHMNEETWQGIAISARLSRTLYESRFRNS
nr:M14 metal carboxypeptidase-like 17 [Antheraea pernyi]